MKEKKEYVPDYENADYTGLTQLMNNTNITNKENENKENENKENENENDIEVEEEEDQDQDENKIIWPKIKIIKDDKQSLN